MGAALGCVDERHEPVENPEEGKKGRENGQTNGFKADGTEKVDSNGRDQSPWRGRELNGVKSRGRSITPRGEKNGQTDANSRSASGRRVSFGGKEEQSPGKGAQSSWTWGGAESEEVERGRNSKSRSDARAALKQACLTLDVEKIQQAIYVARTAGLTQSELEEANEAKLRGHTIKKARAALRDAINRNDEDALRSAIELADTAKLDARELEEALSVLSQMEHDDVGGGPRGVRKKALQRLELALKSRRDADLIQAIEQSEAAGIGKDDIQYANAKQLLKTNESRRRMAKERRKRETTGEAPEEETEASRVARVRKQYSGVERTSHLDHVSHSVS